MFGRATITLRIGPHSIIFYLLPVRCIVRPTVTKEWAKTAHFQYTVSMQQFWIIYNVFFTKIYSENLECSSIKDASFVPIAESWL